MSNTQIREALEYIIDCAARDAWEAARPTKIRCFWHRDTDDIETWMVQRLRDGWYALAADSDVNDSCDEESAVVAPEAWARTIEEALA